MSEIVNSLTHLIKRTQKSNNDIMVKLRNSFESKDQDTQLFMHHLAQLHNTSEILDQKIEAVDLQVKR